MKKLVLTLLFATLATAVNAANPLLLKLRGDGGLAPSAAISVASTERKPLVAVSSIAATISAIPAGNTVTVSASVANPFYISYATAPTLPTLGPGTGATVGGVTQGVWTGAGDSGYSSWQERDWFTPSTVLTRSAIPAPDTRTTAMPTLRIATIPRQAFDEDLIISFVGRAVGEINFVRVYDEGNYVDVTRSVRTYQDVNGVWRHIDGFHAKLDYVRHRDQVALGGAINIFARAVPNDTSMQTQLIGASYATANATKYATALYFFPRPVANDWTRTVCATGNGQTGATYNGLNYAGLTSDYTDIDDALAARATLGAGAKAGLIIFTCSGAYYPTSPATSGVYNSLEGYLEVVAAIGVNVSIGRASYDPTVVNTISNAQWRPNVNGLMFIGSGISLDHTYMQRVQPSGSTPNPALPFALVGAKIIAPGRNLAENLYWDKNLNTASVFPWSVDSEIYHSVAGFTYLALNNTYREIYGDFGSVGNAVVGNTIDKYSPRYFTVPYTGFTTTYSGANPTATIGLSGGTWGVSLPTTFTMTDGVTRTCTITTLEISDLVACINTIGNGWSATMVATPNDGRTDRSLIQAIRTTSINAKNVAAITESRIDLHQDLYSLGTGTHLNKVFENTTVTGARYVQTAFWDRPSRDITSVNQAIDALGSEPFGPLSVIAQWGTADKSHLFSAHNADPSMVLSNSSTGAPAADAYTQQNNIVQGSQSWSTAASANPVFKNGWFVSGISVASSKSGTTSTGSSADGLFPLRAIGDFTPSASLAAVLVPSDPAAPFDLYGNTRQANDANGPVAKRLTDIVLTKEQFATLAIVTRAAAAGSNVGTVVATYKTGAGNTGSDKIFTAVVSVE